jgi:hypothetical protein
MDGRTFFIKGKEHSLLLTSLERLMIRMGLNFLRLLELFEAFDHELSVSSIQL